MIENFNDMEGINVADTAINSQQVYSIGKEKAVYATLYKSRELNCTSFYAVTTLRKCQV